VLNAARFSVDQCVDLILAALDRLRAAAMPGAASQSAKTPQAIEA
jgi:hypothetical protein